MAPPFLRIPLGVAGAATSTIFALVVARAGWPSGKSAAWMWTVRGASVPLALMLGVPISRARGVPCAVSMRWNASSVGGRARQDRRWLEMG